MLVLAIVPLLFLTWMSLLMTRLWISRVYSKKHRCSVPAAATQSATQSADQSNYHSMSCFDLPRQGTWLNEITHHQKAFDWSSTGFAICKQQNAHFVARTSMDVCHDWHTLTTMKKFLCGTLQMRATSGCTAPLVLDLPVNSRVFLCKHGANEQ